jgi:hypothetical protein
VIEKVMLTAAFVVALTVASPVVAARPKAIDATKAGCASAYEAAQEERLKKQLLSAREHLVTCGATSCPPAMQRECIGWLAEVDAALPTVVVRAFVAGSETTEVRVLVDGHEVAAQLDGSAIPLDPGPHAFRFEHAGDAPIEGQRVLVEGERLKPIEVRFGASVAAPRKVGLPLWIAAGTGAVGFASFAIFGAAGLVDYEHLKSTCSPNCSPGASNVVKARFAIADVSLGIGVVAAGVAAALYFSGKGMTDDTKTAALRVDVDAVRGGAFARMSTSF